MEGRTFFARPSKAPPLRPLPAETTESVRRTHKPVFDLMMMMHPGSSTSDPSVRVSREKPDAHISHISHISHTSHVAYALRPPNPTKKK